MKNYNPERPASEDDTTIASHVAWLLSEKKKKQPDYKAVSVAMGKTLADRRKWIIQTEPRPTAADIKKKYPWLFDEDQVIYFQIFCER